jgi:uncharacterized membrane protein YcaP (DUF421 family)
MGNVTSSTPSSHRDPDQAAGSFSVLASAVVSKDTTWFAAASALLALFAVQWVTALLRTRSDAVETALDNRPLLLMDGEAILDDNLRKAQMTRSDLIAKLREANVLDPAEVRAVVMETTGDVSVLHGPPGGTPLADMLVDGVRR